MGYFVHETAEVSEKAYIGDETKIWNHSQVREGAKIGECCNIGKNVYVDANVKVGNRVKVQNNVNIYHGVEIEDDVFLGPSCTFTNDLYPRAYIEDWKVLKTHVGKGASIGANATIVCGVNIGDYAMIGAGSVVCRDVKPFSLVVGNPAKCIGWICKCGIRLSFDKNTAICSKCGIVYANENEFVTCKGELDDTNN